MSVATARAKVKEKGMASLKKGKQKGILLKKPVSKVIGKRKRSKKYGAKGPGPSPKLGKISRAPGTSAKGTDPLVKASTSAGKEKRRECLISLLLNCLG